MDKFYIVASCKPWHRIKFDRYAAELSGRWAYVSDPDELVRAINLEHPRYVFFLHWNWKVQKSIWQNYECVCFHMTDVPYGRGGSPLQNLIVRGYKSSTLTALKMVQELDAGPVYQKRALSLDGRAEDIYLRAGDLCWELIDWMIRCEPRPVPQEGEVTHFVRRKPSESALPKEGELQNLYDHIRMLDAPTYPLAFIDHGEFFLEFSHASKSNNEITASVRIRKKSGSKDA